MKEKQDTQYHLFHPHQTPEENLRVRYHIIGRDSNTTLCGIDTRTKLFAHSRNFDPISRQWYLQNIQNGYPYSYICKRCTQKITKIFNG